MPDKAWKRLERTVGKLFRGRRVHRMGDYGKAATDVLLEDLSQLRIDCKLRRAFKHHSLIEEIRRRYCRRDSDVPVLVTKEFGKYRYLVTVDADFFAELLDAYRAVRSEPADGSLSDFGARPMRSRIASRGSLPS